MSTHVCDLSEILSRYTLVFKSIKVELLIHNQTVIFSIISFIFIWKDIEIKVNIKHLNDFLTFVHSLFVAAYRPKQGLLTSQFLTFMCSEANKVAHIYKVADMHIKWQKCVITFAFSIAFKFSETACKIRNSPYILFGIQTVTSDHAIDTLNQ